MHRFQSLLALLTERNMLSNVGVAQARSQMKWSLEKNAVKIEPRETSHVVARLQIALGEPQERPSCVKRKTFVKRQPTIESAAPLGIR